MSVASDGRATLWRRESGTFVPLSTLSLAIKDLLPEPESQPILTAHATESVTSEYRLDADLPGELARRWAGLKVTDRMPFRLILRPAAGVR